MAAGVRQAIGGGPPALPSIQVLNHLPAGAFAATLAPLFEGAPRFLVRLAADRPFTTYADLWRRALAIARAMPEAEQVELIDAHPRLGAPPAGVSALSLREQGDERTDAPASELAIELDRLNGAYEAKFGFRLCVFVNGRSRAELLPIMAAAIGADRSAEIRRALGEVVAIAADRARLLAR